MTDKSQRQNINGNASLSVNRPIDIESPGKQIGRNASKL